MILFNTKSWRLCPSQFHLQFLQRSYPTSVIQLLALTQLVQLYMNQSLTSQNTKRQSRTSTKAKLPEKSLNRQLKSQTSCLRKKTLVRLTMKKRRKRFQNNSTHRVTQQVFYPKFLTAKTLKFQIKTFQALELTWKFNPERSSQRRLFIIHNQQMQVLLWVRPIESTSGKTRSLPLTPSKPLWRIRVQALTHSRRNKVKTLKASFWWRRPSMYRLAAVMNVK